jgi:DNA-binding winged helix-turn-helix (wHTH) protein
MATREVYQFREFTLDVGERRLSRGEVPVHLPPKAHDLLVMLIQQPGRLLTKDELLARIWPDAFVEEGILTVHVSAVRKALGDDTRPPTYIETVSGSGYRFIASVTPVLVDAKPDAARQAIRPLEVYELVGRGRLHLMSGSYFELPHAVSNFHAAIEIDPTYAPAHAGLALTCCAQAGLRSVPHREAYAQAKSRPCVRLLWMMRAPMRKWRWARSCFSANGIGSAPRKACAVRSKSTPPIPKP